MSHAFNEQSFPEEELSALMDGELDADAAEAACARWRDDPAMRSRWHAYHLIGDVLRSEELAADRGRDAVFLSQLRQRLADEPVVLAPGVSGARPRRSWMAPAAVAAGFAAVAGVLVVTQMAPFAGTTGERDVVAERSGSPLRAVNLAAASGAEVNAASFPAVTLNGQLVRDARLDEYLAAHKKFGGSSMSGAPSGSLRNAALDGSPR